VRVGSPAARSGATIPGGGKPGPVAATTTRVERAGLSPQRYPCTRTRVRGREVQSSVQIPDPDPCTRTRVREGRARRKWGSGGFGEVSVNSESVIRNRDEVQDRAFEEHRSSLSSISISGRIVGKCVGRKKYWRKIFSHYKII